MLSPRVVEMTWSAAKLDEREGGGSQGVRALPAVATGQPEHTTSPAGMRSERSRAVPARAIPAMWINLAQFSVPIGMIGAFGLKPTVLLI
jgi:hypothetical protein